MEWYSPRACGRMHLLANFVQVVELKLSSCCQSNDTDTYLVNNPKPLDCRNAEKAQNVRTSHDSSHKEAGDAWQAQLRCYATKNPACWGKKCSTQRG